MKIVIDIDEIAYEGCLQLVKHGEGSASDISIINGTPLPKGHGRLIDADVLEELKEPMYESSGDMKGYGVLMSWIREFTPTIIEADKEDNT